MLQHGSALDIPYPSEGSTNVILWKQRNTSRIWLLFASETHRILKPGGRLAITTFFMPHPAAEAERRTLIETIENGIDVVSPIDTFRDDLRKVGFGNVCVESIGEHVWRALDAWLAQTEYRDGWGRNWLRPHQLGLIDYYLATADKP